MYQPGPLQPSFRYRHCQSSIRTESVTVGANISVDAPGKPRRFLSNRTCALERRSVRASMDQPGPDSSHERRELADRERLPRSMAMPLTSTLRTHVGPVDRQGDGHGNEAGSSPHGSPPSLPPC